jgi:adenylate kinase family enzyme
MKTVIIVGRSGSGKGTQIARLMDRLNQKGIGPIERVESGARFRKFFEGDSYAAGLARAINDRGGLQPEFLSVWVWGTELIDKLTPETFLLMDGMPRRLSEADTLDGALEFYGREDATVVYLRTSREWGTERLIGRGRADDVERADIDARMGWFDREVAPVIEFYRNHPKHRFVEVDGERPIEVIHEEIAAALGL